MTLSIYTNNMPIVSAIRSNCSHCSRAAPTQSSLPYGKISICSNTTGTTTAVDETLKGTVSMPAQTAAQKALLGIQAAINSKDKIRASLGVADEQDEYATSSLHVQTDNLLSANSHIADIDITVEMTEFVRKHILSQSTVLMLSQTKSLPKMALSLIAS